MALEICPLSGDALAQSLDEIAALRIAVFRAWPYLYDGDLAYERGYLQRYLDSEYAIVLGAFAGDQLVGASTGTPLSDHAADFAHAFELTGFVVPEIFYCAESVLLSGYRGLGVGHAFFDARETHAHRLGFTKACFCSVLRAPDHPERPEGYRPLDDFWRKRGYAPLPGVIASFAWKDIGAVDENAKQLQFWMRDLPAR